MKRGLVVVGIVIATLGALAVRVVIEGRGALADGDAAAAKRPREAIAAWESAARWYLPLAPHVDLAYARLVRLAESEPEHALAAWRAVRRAALATRTWWTPRAEDLERANAAIAALSARHPEAAAAAGSEKAAFHAELLAADRRPSPVMAGLAILGILSWLAGIGVLVRRGIDPAGRPVRRWILVGLGLTVAGLVAWAVGLYNA